MAGRGVKKCWGVRGGGTMEDKDFNKDVLSVAKERDDSSCQKTISACKDCASSSAWPQSAAPRKIPRANNTTLLASDTPLVKGSSAPMDIPDWSKIYGKSCKKGSRNNGSSNIKGGDDDEDDDMVTPHEWIARKLRRSQISSFSVCEGMGRRLKGRDRSKVRNAILTKTGFIE